MKFFLALLALASGKPLAAAKPNIVSIFTDDPGCGDPGCLENHQSNPLARHHG